MTRSRTRCVKLRGFDNDLLVETQEKQRRKSSDTSYGGSAQQAVKEFVRHGLTSMMQMGFALMKTAR
jgi:hypothetical protein